MKVHSTATYAIRHGAMHLHIYLQFIFYRRYAAMRLSKYAAQS